ncbi:MAG: hypothetical protein ACPGXL_06380, partial [Chitinophagales bacterium]
MAKKDLNVFDVSFIDLLSGALGAVLILFVVVPKLTEDHIIAVEELEQMKQLETEMQDIEAAMAALRSTTVDKSALKDAESQTKALEAQAKAIEVQMKKIEETVKKMESTTKELSKEVENLQKQLAKCQGDRKSLKDEISELKKNVKQLEDRIKNNDTLVEQLKEQMKEQKKQKEEEITKLQQEVAKANQVEIDLNEDIQEESSKVAKLETDKSGLQSQIASLKKELAKAKEEIKTKTDKIKGYEERAGLKFADKNIVFVVDISGSMDEADPPSRTRRIDEVKAGLKMMIATMDDSYSVDIVVYPKSQDDKYGYKFGSLKTVTDGTKYDLYNYINGLKPGGCTPTKEVMEYVLGNYSDAGTVTLLSDGLPTNRVSYTDCKEISDTGGLA